MGRLQGPTMNRQERRRKLISRAAFRAAIEKRRAEKHRRREAKVREVRELGNLIYAGPLALWAGEEGALFGNG